MSNRHSEFRTAIGGWRRPMLAVLAVIAISVVLSTNVLAARGQIAWAHQWFTANNDATTAIAVVPTGKQAPNDLDIYVAGVTDGGLEDSTGTCSGNFDVFVARYRSDGTRVWYHRFGKAVAHDDSISDIAADRNGVYVVGQWDCHLPTPQSTQPVLHAFVRRYARGGDLTFDQVLANAQGKPAYASAAGVALDANSFYVSGSAVGRLQGSPGAFQQSDGFVRRYNKAGNGVVWTRQFGTNDIDYGGAVAVSGNRVYVSAVTALNFATRFFDMVLARYGTNGQFVDAPIFGSPGIDQPSRIAVQSTGAGAGIYVVGQTNGSLGHGGQNIGNYDAFILKRNITNTATVWARELGAGLGDSAAGIALNNGGVAVAGYVMGHLPGQKQTGLTDGFVRQYTSAGAVVWTREFGTKGVDKTFASTLTGDIAFAGGSFFIGGGTDGEFQNMPGNSDSRLEDAWLLRMDAK